MMRFKHIARLVATCAFACALMFSVVRGGLPAQAFADVEGANIVDPAQRADNSFIYDTTVSSLYSQASLYNDHTVQVTGEVVGDCIRANNDLCWISLTETIATDSSTMSVLMSPELAAQIDSFGRYGVKGTTLQVRGIYYQACDEHDGLPDIHTTHCSVLERGDVIPDTVNGPDLAFALFLVAVGLALIGLFYVVQEKTR